MRTTRPGLVLAIFLSGCAASLDTMLPGVRVPPGYSVRREAYSQVTVAMFLPESGRKGPTIFATYHSDGTPPAVREGRTAGAPGPLEKGQWATNVTVGAHVYPARRHDMDTRFDPPQKPAGREEVSLYFAVPDGRWVLLMASNLRTPEDDRLLADLLASVRSLPPEPWQLKTK